ncbi:MAG: DUF5666 domain-containing protein [Gammaproteobacteria bacterium]|nr:DUF5666 domain-containing protein [Gammaproteobacteria bacterium]
MDEFLSISILKMVNFLFHKCRNFEVYKWIMPILLGVSACGGGLDLAGLGSGGTGVNQGTVIGFGSIYVDGIEIDDSGVVPIVDNGKDSMPTIVEMGETVKVQSLNNGVQKIEVIPQVIGFIEMIHSDSVQVNRQIIQINDVMAKIPTIFAGGISKFSDLTLGDMVEVHGEIHTDRTQRTKILATRIIKLNKELGSSILLKVSGVVSELSSNVSIFSMGDLTVDFTEYARDADTSYLTNSAWVEVFGTLEGGRLVAKKIKALALFDSSVNALGVGGFVESIDEKSNSITILGTTFVLKNTVTNISPGDYINLNGKLTHTNGKNVIDSYELNPKYLGIVQLKGSIDDPIDGGTLFKVRDVPVDARLATISNCVDNNLSEGQIVTIVGVQQVGAPVVRATSLQCVVPVSPVELEKGRPRIYSFLGTINGQICNIEAGSVAITLASGESRSLFWNNTSIWYQLEKSNICQFAGKVRVEATYMDGNYAIKTIRPLGIKDADNFRATGNSKGHWDAYLLDDD